MVPAQGDRTNSSVDTVFLMFLMTFSVLLNCVSLSGKGEATFKHSQLTFIYIRLQRVGNSRVQSILRKT